MLEVRHITLTLEHDRETRTLLDDVTFTVSAGHLLAIVGPSGCGKTTLMKVIAGLKEEDEGEIRWQGRNLAEEGDLHPSELGYVPQFSIAHGLLTVEECIESAVALRTQLPTDEAVDALIKKTLQQTGLTPLVDRPVKVLSGGQKRRLGLALELVTDPALLLCDEVTSGLDPKSEKEITHLLHELSRNNPQRIIINVTHSLTNLQLYDTILVLHEGRVVYHGPPRALQHYFSVEQAEDVYPKLARRSAERWGDSWKRHRDSYYSTYGLAAVDKPKEEDLESITDREPDREHLPSNNGFAEDDIDDDDEAEIEAESKNKKRKKEEEEKPKKKHHEHDIAEEYEVPSFIAQTRELLSRRWLIFKRDKAQMWLQLAMIFGFPLLVVIFGFDGVPQVRTLSQRQNANFITEAKEQSDYLTSLLKAGSLVSGLILMQVVLVTLMASNNAAREIAGERDILERERLGGLRPLSYVASKVLFLGTFVLAQSLWMGLFVEMLCPGVPGNLFIKLALLIMASAAMTSICLGISGIMRSPEKSTILCIYLVGFQLPLSGAVLALPKSLEPIFQPFIAAFWSWSGSLYTMKDTAFYEAVKKVTASTLESPSLALFVLSIHVVIGLVMAYVGTKRSQWD